MNKYTSFAEAMDKSDIIFKDIPIGKKAIVVIGPKNSGKTTFTYPLSKLSLKKTNSTNGSGFIYEPQQQY